MSKLYKYDVDITDIIGSNCFNIFLNSLKLHIPSFVTYYENETWFTLMNIETEYTDFVNNFDCEVAEEELRRKIPKEPEMLIMQFDPDINTNPTSLGLIWINEITGKMFTCTSKEIDNNIWVSTDGLCIIRPTPAADTFDFFNDDSTVAFYQLNDNSIDMGGKYNGKERNIIWEKGLEGSCASSKHAGQIQIKKLPFDKTTPEVTIGAWLKWNGSSGCMPFGFREHDAYCYNGNLGFNTAAGDLYSMDFKEYKNKWIYAIFTFRAGQYGKIYLNGIEQPLSQKSGHLNSGRAIMNSTFNIFGWGRDRGYRKFGLVERLRILNRSLTSAEAYELSKSEMDFISSINKGLTWS